MNQTLLMVVVLLGAGCGVGYLTSSSEAETEGRESLAGGLKPGDLRYEPDVAELAAVRAAAAKWWPDATVTVSPARGTVATAFGISVPLRGCRDVALSALEQLSTMHDVFRLDGGEWQPRHVLSCHQVPPDGAWVSVERVRAGQVPIAGQVLHLRVRRLVNVAKVDAVVGWYLPTLPRLEAELAARVSLPDEKLLTAALEEPLPFRVFDFCRPLYDSAYKAQEGDVSSLGAGAWHPVEEANGVRFELQRVVRLEVGAANVTPELRQSDAYCPPVVGFNITVDALEGKVLDRRPGLGCIVCAAP